MKRRNFSLIELLVVIAIIAILAGISFPVLSGINKKGKETKARSEISALVMAIKQYETDYGTLPYVPNTSSPPDEIALTDAQYDMMLEILMNTTPAGAATTHGNPKRVRYLDPPTKKVTPNGGRNGYYFIDPWKNRYHIALDLNYDGKIDCGSLSNFGGETGILMAKALVYSGNDGKKGAKEYILSWKTGK